MVNVHLARLLMCFLALLLAASPAPAQDKGMGFGKPGLPGLPGLPGAAPAAQTEPVVVTAASARGVVAPGDTLALAAVIQFGEGWHAWTNDTSSLPAAYDFAVPTRVWIPADEAAHLAGVGEIQWPEPGMAPVFDLIDGEGTIDLPSFKGRVIVYLPVVIAQDAPAGGLTIPLRVEYQACNDVTCEQPTIAEADVRVRVAPQEEVAQLGAPAGRDASLFEGFDPSGFAKIGALTDQEGASGGGSMGDRTFFGVPVPSAQSPAGWAVIALLGVLGGVILNLTPCVLPVIPIKIMTITQHAGSPGKSLALGVWMALGVVGFWLALGVLAAAATAWADPSRLFGKWWITLGIGVLITAMGVGIMGAFSIKLPQSVYAVNPKADTSYGSFLFGVMTGVLGLPCFGFVAGALLAGAATMPKAAILSIFLGIGVGMASPYLVLSAKPSWVERIPRTGPASDLVKQVMGLLLLAAGVYFVGAAFDAWAGGQPFRHDLPWWAGQVKFWLIAVCALAAGGWLVVQTFRITRRPGPRGLFAAVGVVIGGVASLYAVDASIKAWNNFWTPYTPDLLAEARSSGDVVVVDFTAEWCINCKVLEAGVLNRDPVRSLLTADGVVALKADNTSDKAEGWALLQDLGQTGIPLLAIWGPGTGDAPWLSNAYTSDQVRAALERARGDAEAGPASAAGPITTPSG